MEWISTILETPPKRNSKSHIIKGIAKINDQLYLLDYVLFSNFEWWAALLLDSIDDYESAKINVGDTNLFYNSTTNSFCTHEELPENIQKLIIPTQD